MKNKKHKLTVEISYETNKESYKGHGKPKKAILYCIEQELEIALQDDNVFENLKVKKVKTKKDTDRIRQNADDMLDG